MKPVSEYRPNRRSERALRVCKVAAKLFNRQGYIETNMEDIAAAAKLSKGGIYHYFLSKDEILFSILDNYLDVILEGLREDLGKREDPSIRIQFIISRHIDLYTRYPSESKALLHDAHCLPKRYYETIAEKEREYYGIVADVLSDFLGGKKVVSKAQVTVMTFLLFGMCNWIYSWYHPKGPIGPDDLSKTIWTLFLGGVHKYSVIKKG